MGTEKIKILLLMIFLSLFMIPCGDAVASDKVPEKPDISLEKAIQMALDRDEQYKKAELDVVIASEMAEYAVLSMSGYSTTGVQGVTEGQILSYKSSDITYQMSKKSLQSSEDRVTNNITQKYGAVLVAEARYAKAQSEAVLARRDYAIAQTKLKVGMISQLAFEAAQKSYESSDSTLDASQQEVEGAYAAFNPLIGLWAVDRPVLTDGTEFKNLEVADLEYEVYRVLDTAPSIWQAEQAAILTDYQMNVLVYTGTYQPYEARQAEVEQSQLDAITAKEQIANSTRNIYYQIKSIESQYAIMENTIQQAEINVKTQQAMFDAGMTTKLELDTAINTLEGYKAELVQLKWAHRNLVNTFEKPWAASS